MNDRRFESLIESAHYAKSIQNDTPETLEEKNPRPPSGNTRRGRKRSRQACSTCRKRKVRCDVVIDGSPCSNCRLDNVLCLIPISRGQRGLKLNHSGLNSETQSTISTKRLDSSLHLNKRLREDCVFEAPKQNRIESKPEGTNKYCWLVDYSEDRDLRSFSTICSKEAAHCDLFPSGDFDPNYNNKSRQQESQDRSPSHVNFLLGIFKPIPPGLTVADVSYLHQQGAFSLPPRFLRIELFRCYVESVHCKMPFLDLDDIREIVMDSENILESRRGLVPLLLFQAVMYAGSVFIDSDYIRKVGFESRDFAQSVYFSRVKLLYTFDCETDPISIIQSVLLMASSPFKSDNFKDRWHWLGLAISLCYGAGLHRGRQYSNLSPRNYRLRRRVWWTCFVLDRVVALAEGRPVRISRSDCDIPMLSFDDFNMGGEDLGISSAIIEAFTEKAMLCWCSSGRLISTFLMDPITDRSTEIRLGKRERDPEVSIFDNVSDGKAPMVSAVSSPDIRIQCTEELGLHFTIPELTPPDLNSDDGNFCLTTTDRQQE